MASSDRILEQLEDAREELKHEISKEAYARRLLVLGVVMLSAATTLGPGHLIPEALAIVGGILGGIALFLGSGFVIHFMFSTDWRVGDRYSGSGGVNHKRFIKHLRRKVTKLEASYSEALEFETK